MSVIESVKSSIVRLYLVVKADLFSRYLFFWPFSMTVFCVVLLLSLINGPSIEQSFYFSTYGLVVNVGIAVVASAAFKDVYKSSLVHDWLLLPAATYEKVLSRIILTFPAFVVLVNLIFFITSLFSYAWSFLLNHKGTVIFIPFSHDALVMLPHLIVLHSIFFFGSSVFRKSPFFKTMLSVVVLFLILFILGSFSLAKILTLTKFDTASGVQFSFLNGKGSTSGIPFSFKFPEWVDMMIQILYYVCMPLFFWAMPFFRMRRLEAQRAL